MYVGCALFLCCLKGCHSPGVRGPSMGPYPIHNIRSQVVDQEEVSSCAWRQGEDIVPVVLHGMVYRISRVNS